MSLIVTSSRLRGTSKDGKRSEIKPKKTGLSSDTIFGRLKSRKALIKTWIIEGNYKMTSFIRVCLGLFLSHFWSPLQASIIFKAAGAIEEIGSSIKPSYHNQILACSNLWNHQAKLRQSFSTCAYCMRLSFLKNFLGWLSPAYLPWKRKRMQ